MKRLFSNSISNWFSNAIRNSKYRWLVILGSLVYLVSPLDISPDVFPVIGWIDDGLLATIVLTELTQIAAERRRKIRQSATETSDQFDTETVIDIESVTVS